jgi:lysine 2,3-aminomutase
MENTEESLINWKCQLSNSITTLSALKNEIELTPEEEQAINPTLPLRITPYYLDLCKNDLTGVLRKTVIPSSLELIKNENEDIDPLNEDKYSPVKGIVHRYSDRVLFLTTTFCSTYCRFCTRSRIVGKNDHFNTKQWDAGIDYINKTPNIREVIVSGGDPLTLSTDRLEYLLSRLRAIKHIEIIRIGSKIPAVLPMRIDDDLCNMLKKYSPIYMSLHFTHELEFTEKCCAAVNKLADAGIVLKSQTVLLKGVNDNIQAIKNLMHKLLINRISPYYLYYPDYVVGSEHFRPSIDTAINIIKELRTTTSGIACPNLIFDGKYGKICVNPENIIENNQSVLKLIANNGEILVLNK